MLKKFLKFLKGTSHEEAFDGSYLDHMLEQVRPRVQAHLEQCPEHDPLLLVVAEILRLTKPEQWTEQLACPLVDDQSPALSAPAPPPPQLADESSEGFEIVEASEVDESDERGLPEDREAEEHTEADPTTAADGGAEHTGDAPEADESHETAGNDEDEDEDEGGEDEPSVDSPDEVHVDVDAHLGNAEVRPPDTVPEAHEDVGGDELDPGQLEKPVAEAKQLDSSEVLQAGRIFLGLLIENDRLPLDMQLSPAETMLARDLLLGYFVRNDQFDDKVKELLSLVEQKFNDGAFSQARILLQLFQRDRPSHVSNDRNLFYEDMILRLGIRRRHMINNTQLAELTEKSSAADLDVGLTNATAWLDENLHIKFHLFTRRPDEADAWRALAAQSRRDGAEDVFSRYIPPKRWRPLHTASQPPTERMLAHVSAATIKRYIVRQLKTCYFVLRAVGDTGLEPFLDVFFDWSESKFDFNSVRLMPLVYRQTMSETLLIDKIFEEAFKRFYQEKAAQFLSNFDEDTILEATRATLDELSSLDFNRIAPGNYDLGGLVLDRLFGLAFHEPEFAFKVHRLT